MRSVPAEWLLKVAVAGLLCFRFGHSSAEGQDNDDFDPRADTNTLRFERDPAQLISTPAEISGLAFSAGDEFLAASTGSSQNEGGPGEVRIWDFAQKKELATYPSQRGDLNVAISPDGRRVAWSSWSGDVWLREVGGAELVHELLDAPARIAFSPDGRTLVAATEHFQLRSWDVASGKPLEKFAGETFPFFWVGFSPDGKYLIACGGKEFEAGGATIAVWDAATRQQLYRLSDNIGRVFYAAISPDSKTLATGDGHAIVLRDLTSGNRRGKTEETSRPIVRVEFSPDGTLLAGAGDFKNDGVVTLWDTASGNVVGTLAGHERDVRALAFTHDSRLLATGGGDRSLRLWNVATRQQVGTLQEPNALAAPKSAFLAVTYSPDGTSVAAAAEDGQVSIYRLAPPGPVRSWPAHTDAASAIAFSPDGQTLVSGGYDKTIRFWNTATGEQIRSLTGHGGWVVSLAFSPDGQTLASGSYDRSIRLWSAANGLELRTLAGHSATVRSLVFSRDGKLLASGAADHTLRLWDPTSGQEQAKLVGHESGVRSIAFAPGGRQLVSGGDDGKIKVWNVSSRELVGTLSGHNDIVSAVGFAQRTLVSISWDMRIRTWDIEAMEPRGNLFTEPTPLVALAIAPEGRRLLTASGDQGLALWRATIPDGRPLEQLGQFKATPLCAALSPDGESLAMASVGKGPGEKTDLVGYDLAGGGERYRLSLRGRLRSLALAPKGDLVALALPGNQLLLADVAGTRELVALDGESSDARLPTNVRFEDVAFSADGKLLAAGSLDHSIRIFNLEQRALVGTLSGHVDTVLSLAFSPDGRRLVSGGKDRTAIVWDLASGEKQSTLSRHSGTIDSVVWSPDGKTVATACASGICNVWNADDGSLLWTRLGHQGAANHVRFSPNGKLLVTTGDDRLVSLWDATTGEPLSSLVCHAVAVQSLWFSADGKSFITLGRNGEVRRWALPPVEPSGAD